MTSKHTPGPWSVTHDAERGLRDEVAVFYGAGRDGALYVVAERSAFDTPDFRAMRQANARLVAAAPDSHAANVAMVDALNVAFGITSGHDDEYIYDTLPTSGVANAYFAARAAATKATGEQP